jgi:transposase-like protein
MAKYSKKIVNDICKLIKQDSYSIAEICLKVGISERSYYNWQSNNAEFAESIKRAEQDFNSLLIVEAKKSLMKLVQGYEVEETRTAYVDKDGKPRIKEKISTIKHYQPNPTAIIFTLTNRDSDNWKNRQNTELTGKDGKDLEPTVIILPSNNRNDNKPDNE